MCTPRKTLTTHLLSEFQNDVKLAENCKMFANKAMKQKLATRLFDQFPCLLPAADMTRLVHELRRILVSIDSESIIEKNNGFSFTEEDDKNAIFEWQMKIIEKGTMELFDRKHLKSELANLLGLENNKIPRAEILCAYVGAINQHVIQQFENQFKKLMLENTFVFNMIFYHVNKKYGKWCKTILTLLEHIPLNTPISDMEHFAKNLENIILKINISPKTFMTLSENNKATIAEWQLKLIRDGIHRALDEDGNFHLKFLKKMGLEDEKISAEEFMYIYARAYTHHIVEMNKSLLEKNEKVANILLNYVSSHTLSWIKNELGTDYVLIPSKIELPVFKKHSSPGILLVLAAAVTTAGAGYASYMLFKNAKEETKPDLLKFNTKTLVAG